METLKASRQGLQKIRQARLSKGWTVDDFRWMELASRVLGVTWEESGKLASGISEGTWKRFLAGKQAIKAEAFRAYCQVLDLDWRDLIETDSGSPSVNSLPHRPSIASLPAITQPAIAAENPQLNKSSENMAAEPLLSDWGDAPDVSFFFGRCEELHTLLQWIAQDHCRLVTLLGMGGIGKTALSVKLAMNLSTGDTAPSTSPFEFVIWRSLRNSPALHDLLADLISSLSNQPETQFPAELDERISWLLNYLRGHRGLLILDNLESILQPGDRTGRYQDGYETYGQLLRSVAEIPHQSCVILTSREKPLGLAKFEGENLPVRSLQLSGLPTTHSRELFNLKGTFTGTEAEWQTLIARYAGNPLALKIVASSIREFFDGSISTFLELAQQSAYLFDDIRDLLDQHFQRLTAMEQSLMYWLAVNREPVTLTELQTDLVDTVPTRELIESLNSLQRRSLIEKVTSRQIEKTTSSFTQQPVVMEYMINQLIETFCDEIQHWNQEDRSSPYPLTSLLTTQVLTKATAKEYVRETQLQLIVQPIATQLLPRFGSPAAIAQTLQRILQQLQGRAFRETGYAAGNVLSLLNQLEVDFSGYDFSNLAIWQAYLQGVHLHDVDFTNAEFSRCVFTETLGNTLAATFSPDGQLMATCDTDCRVRLWNVQTGQLLVICDGHTNWVRAVTFSPDGQVLASCGADGMIKLWEVRDGICIKTLLGHQHEIFSIAFSPDGQQLASAAGDRTIKLWDTWTGHCLNTLTGHTDWVRSVAFSLDGSLLASGSADHTIKVWDMRTNTCLHTLRGHSGWVRSVAFSPDDAVLASGSGDRTIKLWEPQVGECLATYTGHSSSVYAIAFSPRGTVLVSGSGDRTAKLWDWQQHICIKTLHGHSNEVCAVAVHPDGQTLVCVSLDQTIRLWDAPGSQCLKTWYGHTDWALPVAFSPNGQLLASGSNDKTIKLWDLSSSAHPPIRSSSPLLMQPTSYPLNTLSGHTDFIYHIAFNPSGDLLASASTDSTVRLWQVQTGRCFQVLQGHTDWAYAVAFHPCENWLVSGSADCTLKLWDIQTGQCLKTLMGHTDKILGISFSSLETKQSSDTAALLASASADHSLRLWSLHSGECVRVLQGHENRVYGVMFSPDGETLASCSTDQTIKLWNWQTGHCLKTFTGHSNWVFAIAFSPDGQTLASASHDETVRLWDVQTGICHQVYTGHTRLVSSVAFSPDGQWVASGSQDQTVRLWNAQAGGCQSIFIAKRLYEGMKLTGVKGLTPATITTLQTLGAVVL